MMIGEIILLDFDHTGNGNGNGKAWNFSCHWWESRFEFIFKESLEDVGEHEVDEDYREGHY